MSERSRRRLRLRRPPRRRKLRPQGLPGSSNNRRHSNRRRNHNLLRLRLTPPGQRFAPATRHSKAHSRRLCRNNSSSRPRPTRRGRGRRHRRRPDSLRRQPDCRPHPILSGPRLRKQIKGTLRPATRRATRKLACSKRPDRMLECRAALLRQNSLWTRRPSPLTIKLQHALCHRLSASALMSQTRRR